MARNGSGTYTNPYPNFVSGTVISSTEVDTNNSQIATALTQSIAVDGQAVVTADLPLATHKFTGMKVGTASTDSLSLGQAQAEAFVWCGTAGGSADAITLTPAPPITAYAAGQRFVWMAGGLTNTTGTTVAISGLGTIALQDNGAALTAGQHAAGKMFMGVLNTTSTVQIMNVQVSGTDPLIISSLTVDGNSQFNGTITAGVDDTGYDVKFFGDTASAYMLWDTSTDDLVLAGAAGLVIPDGGNIGSASDTDAIAIAASGTVTLSGDLTVADDVTLSSDAAILGFGANSDVTLVHNHDLGLTLSAGANATQLTITSTDAGASVAPTVALVRNSASPAASDQLGHINFTGEDAGSNATAYAQIIANIVDPTGGGEDGSLDFYCIEAGAGVKALNLTGGDVSLPTDAAILKFGLHDDVLLSHVADSGLTMSVTGNNTATLSVTQDKADASTGPVLNLTRHSASPADADGGGIIQFLMENDNNQLFTAAQIYAVAADVTDGTEDGKLIINTMKAGTATVALTISELGTATFGGNIVIPDGGNVGSATTPTAIDILSDGNVGIGGAGNSGIRLQVTGTTTDTVIYGSGGGHGVYGLAGTSASYVGVLGYAYDTAHYGFLGYSTIGVYGTSVYCVGALYKGSGTFRIPHPLKSEIEGEDWDLLHSFVEGPQCDLIYRGRATLVDGRATVSMDTKYGMTAGTFAWLTEDIQTFTSNETGWDAVKSSFSGDTITIECQNTSSTDTISWMVVAERDDPNIKASEITDDDGNLIIERPSEPPPPTPPTDLDSSPEV